MNARAAAAVAFDAAADSAFDAAAPSLEVGVLTV